MIIQVTFNSSGLFFRQAVHRNKAISSSRAQENIDAIAALDLTQLTVASRFIQIRIHIDRCLLPSFNLAKYIARHELHI